MDPKCSAYIQGSPGAQPRTSMVITSTWTLAGRGRSGWKCLARATSRCKVASRSLLKMAGRGGGTGQSRGAAQTGAPWRSPCHNHPLKTKELCVQPSGSQRSGDIHSEPKTVTLCPRHPTLRMQLTGTSHSVDGASDTETVPVDSYEQLNALQWDPGQRNCWIQMSVT